MDVKLRKTGMKKDSVTSAVLRIVASVRTHDMFRTFEELFKQYSYFALEVGERCYTIAIEFVYNLLQNTKEHGVKVCTVVAAFGGLAVLNVDFVYTNWLSTYILQNSYINNALAEQYDLLEAWATLNKLNYHYENREATSDDLSHIHAGNSMSETKNGDAGVDCNITNIAVGFATEATNNSTANGASGKSPQEKSATSA
eukprot:CFRG0511T1